MRKNLNLKEIIIGVIIAIFLAIFSGGISFFVISLINETWDNLQTTLHTTRPLNEISLIYGTWEKNPGTLIFAIICAISCGGVLGGEIIRGEIRTWPWKHLIQHLIAILIAIFCIGILFLVIKIFLSLVLLVMGIFLPPILCVLYRC